MPKTIKGALAAIVTLFTATDSLNILALEVRVNCQLEASNMIFCDGINGESLALNEQEKLSVTQTCVDEVAGRALVVAHIGEASTRETIYLGQQIEELGVDVVLVIVPCSVPLKQEELIAHYSVIADVLGIPMLLYDTPARTGNTIQSETARVLASHPNIIGIKNSAGGDESLKGFLDVACGIDDFNVPSGPDLLIHEESVEGCSACVSGLANIAPREINAIWSRFHADDIEGSYEAQESVTDLRTDLYKVAFSPVAVKEALQLMGYDVGDSRYAVNFTPKQISEIQQIIRHYSIN